MKSEAKIYRNTQFTQGADSRHVRTQQGIKMAGFLLFFAYFLTLLGVYTVWLKFSIDCKYLKIDEVKQQNYQLDVKIKKLEADVETLRNYQRVEKALTDAGYAMETPKDTFYLRLDGRQDKVEKAEGLAPRQDNTAY